MTHASSIVLTVILASPGCSPTGESPPLVVATAWPSEARDDLQASFSKTAGRPDPISWVILAPGDSPRRVVDRRGGVDVLLGGPASDHDGLAIDGLSDPIRPEAGIAWEAARRPGPKAEFPPAIDELNSLESRSDPRDDPASLALARAVLGDLGWDRGYEALVRHSAHSRLDLGGREPVERSGEGISIVRVGRNPRRARQFVEFLEGRGLAGPESPREIEGSKSDGLLADLLGSALVDALDELHEAGAALDRFGHPAAAESAMGQRPPWPPASVAKLRAGPGGDPLVGTLLEQIAPDPDCRAFLVESWSRSGRAIDGALLAELAVAAEGRLAREPRFRAWLRGEWTAWTRQLYRRVARVARGYVPS